METTDAADKFVVRVASDIYAFGMCILEAFEGELSFNPDDADTIIEKVLTGYPYPQPASMGDDEWAFMQTLIAFD